MSLSRQMMIAGSPPYRELVVEIGEVRRLKGIENAAQSE
jgi:hypothetical protein